MDDKDSASAVEKMFQIFKMNPGLERVDREGRPRKKRSDLQSFNFQKRNKKQVF